MALNKRFNFGPWTIRYQLLGAVEKYDRTVVFVHGTPWSSAVFRPMTDVLAALGGYRILLYDLAGFGHSQALDTSMSNTQVDTSVKTQAQLLFELLKHLRMDGSSPNTAPDVIAHDIAGTIALRAHLVHECQFRSLCLLDTNTVLPWGDGFYKLVRSEPDTFRKLPPAIFEAMVRAVIRSACHNPKNLDSGWERTLAEPWIYSSIADADQTTGQDSFVRQIAQANDADIAEMLDQNMYEKVQCPVKILWGEQDQWIPREKMDRLAEMLKHCLKEFVVIPEAGHLVMIDQPVRVASEIFVWLDEQPIA